MSTSTEKTATSPVNQSKSVETPRGVIFKLYSHTILMIILPLTTYYYASNYYFEGVNKATYAALAAAGIANVVVFSFIITAVLEDSSSDEQKRDKKD